MAGRAYVYGGAVDSVNAIRAWVSQNQVALAATPGHDVFVIEVRPEDGDEIIIDCVDGPLEKHALNCLERSGENVRVLRVGGNQVENVMSVGIPTAWPEDRVRKAERAISQAIVRSAFAHQSEVKLAVPPQFVAPKAPWWKFWAALVVCAATVGNAQQPGAQTRAWPVLPEYTLAGKPGAAVKGRTVYITDCENSSTCAVGGGSTVWLFRDSGTAWAAAHPVGGGGGGVSDGDKGDITVSGGGATWTIDSGVVTFAKIQTIATDRLIGRDAAATGAPEEISVGGGVEFSGSTAIRRSALTGDVTASAGSNTTVLANIPSATPMAGSLLATAIAAPGTPSAGTGSIYVDSTAKNIAVKDDAGVVKHGVQTQSAVSNNWITAINDAGAVSTAQPAFSNLSGSATDGQIPNNITIDLAATATALATPRTIAGVSFDGTANIAIPSTGLSDSGDIVRENTANTYTANLQHFGSAALLLPSSTTRPATCSVGEIYMDTDATSGQRLYACETTDTWVLQGDGGGAGGGITSLEGQTGATQTFTDDTNVTIVSAADTHVITWSGTLAKARQNAATVYNDAANAWSVGAQDFGDAASLKVPTSAGAAPTANGLIAYDSTANAFEGGVNGANKTFAMIDGNVATATALAANGGNCSGSLPRGVDASGAAEGCADVDLTTEVTGVLPTGNLPTASTTASGIAEAAIDTEVTTGTDAARYVTPDALAGSTIFGTKTIEVEVLAPGVAASTGDGKTYFYIPPALNGMNLVGVRAQVYTAGTTNTLNVDVDRCVAAATGNVCSSTVADMLSTNITIDSGENATDTAAAAAVINTSNDDVATGQVLRFNIDAIQTTPSQGLLLILTFQLP